MSAPMTEIEQSSSVNRELLTRLYDAAARFDAEGFLSCLHDDVEILEPAWLPYGGSHRGIAAVEELFGEASKLIDLSRLAWRCRVFHFDPTPLLEAQPSVSRVASAQGGPP